jgi:hypothetical protein
MVNIVEKITKLDVTPTIQVNMLKKFFDQIHIHSKDASYEYDCSYYIAQLGVGNTPILIRSRDKNIRLGENELCLEESKGFSWPPQMVGAFPFNKSDISKLLETDYRGHDNPHQQVGEWLEKIYKPYDMVMPVEKETLKELSDDDFSWVMRRLIDAGFDIDPKTRSWGEMNSIKLTSDPKNRPLVKDKPHGVIVKSEKAGFSHIGARIGDHVDQVTLKSLEGVASCEGDIEHSPLHNNYGSFILDEVDSAGKGSLQKILDYLERGEYVSIKAARRIINRGAACVSFISNPETMKQQENEEIQCQEFISSWLNFTYQLSPKPGPMYSRVGCFIFDNGLMVAQANPELAYSPELYEKIFAIAKAILEFSSPNITKIFWDTQEWLNQPIKEYNEELDEIIEAAGTSLNQAIRDAIKGQKSAYRHIRGGALSLSCFEHLRDILFGDYDIDSIMETAEEKLQILCSYNAGSFKKVIDFSRVIDKPENFVSKFGATKPEYIKPLLLAYALAGRDRKDDEKLSEADLRIAFESIPTEVRIQVLGERYAYWSRVLNDGTKTITQLEKTKIGLQQLFNCAFDFQLTADKPTFWIQNDATQTSQIFKFLAGTFTQLETCKNVNLSGGNEHG